MLALDGVAPLPTALLLLLLRLPLRVLLRGVRAEFRLEEPPLAVLVFFEAARAATGVAVVGGRVLRTKDAEGECDDDAEEEEEEDGRDVLGRRLAFDVLVLFDRDASRRECARAPSRRDDGDTPLDAEDGVEALYFLPVSNRSPISSDVSTSPLRRIVAKICLPVRPYSFTICRVSSHVHVRSTGTLRPPPHSDDVLDVCGRDALARFFRRDSHRAVFANAIFSSSFSFSFAAAAAAAASSARAFPSASDAAAVVDASPLLAAAAAGVAPAADAPSAATPSLAVVLALALAVVAPAAAALGRSDAGAAAGSSSSLAGISRSSVSCLSASDCHLVERRCIEDDIVRGIPGASQNCEYDSRKCNGKNNKIIK